MCQMNFPNLARRVGAVVALSGLAVAASAVAAGGASAAPGPVLTLESGTNGCEGVTTTPGSQNTSKTLVGGSMQPGEQAVFNIDYPVDPSDVGQTFTITDCVFTGTGKDEQAIQKYSISFVPNSASYTLAYAIDVPEDLPLGTLYCNYAKTTAGPSTSQASNRKSNPACFNVGGSLRIEKRADSATGDILPGASFSVVCTPTSEVPPVVVDGLDEANVATTGVIGINGPEGTPCVVTELAAPDGYDLPAVTSQTLTIPRGTSASVVPWVNTAHADEGCPEGTVLNDEQECVTVSESPSESPSPTPTESEGPTLEPDDPTPSVSPTVLGVKIVKRPTPQLPFTGAPTGLLLVAGLALTGLGAAMVLGSGRYARQH
jgi:hypothetical protein